MPRLHRVDPNEPGLTRRRWGRGFAYLDDRGERVTDPDVVERIRGLAIPPAWEDVWICPDPWGHLQATGVDAAGRRQYRYHDRWRARRDREKHRRIEAFGRSLPALRRRVGRDLALPGLPRERVLAGAVRLLDRTALRIGGEEYARRNGSFGLATLRHDHVEVHGDRLELRFNGKAGKEHAVSLRDPAVASLVRSLTRADGDELLAWRDEAGWHDVRAADVNDYLRERIGEEHSAKDFRTWHATVLAASLLAGHDPAQGRRAVTAVIRQVAEQLGNTPAVCRASYVDPRVVDAFLDEDTTITPTGRGRETIERAVLELLATTATDG
ncbi:MAG TPA: DNA topoisomerase IB [Actinomycetota bacterium]